jgi:hypothetical protein
MPLATGTGLFIATDLPRQIASGIPDQNYCVCRFRMQFGIISRKYRGSIVSGADNGPALRHEDGGEMSKPVSHSASQFKNELKKLARVSRNLGGNDGRSRAS